MLARWQSPKAGGASSERSAALFDYPFAAAAVATIAGFALEVWREMKKRMQSDDEGRSRRGRS
ncbi:MAG TPA: hypothetical protein DCP91_00760 [Eggerthellaceae bacterium]|nr:hypothetical protein [Eggerthellaceae bacterium]